MGQVLNSSFLSMKRLGVLLLPPGWDASPSQGYPQHICWYPFVHLGEEKYFESKVSWPQPGLEPGTSNPGLSTLTMRPPRLPEDIMYKPLKANKSCRCASSHSNFALAIKLSSSLSMVRVLQNNQNKNAKQIILPSCQALICMLLRSY